MKRTCLFTKSAGVEKVPNDPIEGAFNSFVNNPDTSGSIFDIDTSGSIFDIIPEDKSSSNWFTEHGDAIGAGIAGLGSGALLTAYIMKKKHAKAMKRLMSKEEKQKEEK